MVHIKVKQGLNLPMEGAPNGDIQPLAPPQQIGLDLRHCGDIKFKLHVKQGDVVKVGQPLASDKTYEQRMFVSPASGVIKEVRRGLKRHLDAFIIDVARQEEYQEYGVLDPLASAEQVKQHLLAGGFFAHIRQRPFNTLANPIYTPKSIFVKAMETAPFAPSAELQVRGHEFDFQAGLNALTCLTVGKVHLVYHVGTLCKAFTHAENVEKHTVEGPHPAANQSVHIAHIDPIKSADDVIWTVTTADVIAIGHFMNTGRYLVDRVFGIGGTGIVREKRQYVKGRLGYPIAGLLAGRNAAGSLRMISGDVLTGEKVGIDDFMLPLQQVFCVIPENEKREFLHFFRLGIEKYSAHRAYLSGHLKPGTKEYAFTTNQHGEERYFVDGSIYEKVMPLHVPVMEFVQSLMAEDYETAERLGLFEVAPEDFALPAFICPSKIEMPEIVKKGLHSYWVELSK